MSDRIVEDYALPPPPVASIAVADEGTRFAVRRIVCVGRNYAEHAREMGHDPGREPPFFFMKPADAVVDSGANLPYPPLTENLHHEIELVVAIGKGGADIAVERALDHVFGYSAGIDLTRRDLQQTAKDLKRPWDWAKGFDRSAPIGPLRRAAAIGHPAKGRIWLEVNGARRQDSDISELMWGVPEVIAFISQAMILRPGDLVMTGTPAGVGPLARGDQVAGGVEGVGEIAISIG